MVLESGRVNSYREALVTVRFREGAAIECVVDTGFNGPLMLPRAFVSQVQIPIVGELTFGMVGGATMSAEVGLIAIKWLGEFRMVEVIVSEGYDALIGTALLVSDNFVHRLSIKQSSEIDARSSDAWGITASFPRRLEFLLSLAILHRKSHHAPVVIKRVRLTT